MLTSWPHPDACVLAQLTLQASLLLPVALLLLYSLYRASAAIDAAERAAAAEAR